MKTITRMHARKSLSTFRAVNMAQGSDEEGLRSEWIRRNSEIGG